MEAVADHALLAKTARQRKGLRHCRLSGMKGGIEAGVLGQPGTQAGQRAHRCQAMRLMQWRQLVQRLQSGKGFGIEVQRLTIAGTAMHDTMTHRPNVAQRRIVFDPLQQACQRPCVVQRCWYIVKRGVLLFIQLSTDPGLQLGPSAAAEARELATIAHLHGHGAGSTGGIEQGELEARGAAVDGQDLATHARALFCCSETSSARAQEAMRVMASSARLVSTIGTRAPTTSPAPVASAR